MKKIAPFGSSEKFLREHVSFTSDDCLIWPFRKVASGYGLAVIGGVQKRASRWMCILAHGDPIPASLVAAHSCGNPSCVNPGHLRWATNYENSQDTIRHGRTPYGERSRKTTLTAQDVADIRSAPPEIEILCERYSVSRGCISKIRHGSRWAHTK